MTDDERKIQERKIKIALFFGAVIAIELAVIAFFLYKSMV